MRSKSVVLDARGVQKAHELITLGARLQLLETETELSRERLLRLYKEVKGESPPRGMLPFSADWFLTWQPNIHATVFMNIHRYIVAHTDARGVDALTTSYKLYLEHVETHRLERVLSITRAWTLIRFLDSKLLRSVPCTLCGGHYVANPMDVVTDFVCGLCRVPSRAGKRKETRTAQPN
jgi:flagellar transcriptional activator FlhC